MRTASTPRQDARPASRTAAPPAALDLEPFERDPVVPLHHQVKEDLVTHLRAGRWVPGSEIPGEELLGRHYGVSRGTLRRALADLEREGLIERFQGRGSFVRQPKLEGVVAGSYRRFRIEGPPLDPGGRVLACRRTQATADLAKLVGVERGTALFHLERVRFARGVPVALQSSWLPATLCPDLPRQDLAARHLVDVLRDAYGVHLVRAEELLEPAVAEPYAARCLGLARGTAVFRIERTTFLGDGTIGEFRRATLRGDIYRYRLELR